MVAQVVATGERKILLQDAADARYVPSGHLVFLRRGVLLAVRFDAKRVEVSGEEVPLLDHVAQALTAGAAWDIARRTRRGSAGSRAVTPKSGICRVRR